MSKLIEKAFGKTKPSEIFMDLLTFERLLTKPVIHIIYWSGLLLLVISCFGLIGGLIGMSFKEGLMGAFLALPVFIGGMLIIIAGALLWRSFCEFYVTIFRIADDLQYLRQEAEGHARAQGIEPKSSHAQPNHAQSGQTQTPAYSGFEEKVITPKPLDLDTDILDDPFSYRRVNVSDDR